MLIGELINELKNYPPDMRVLVGPQEYGGFEDALSVEIYNVALNAGSKSVLGIHAEYDEKIHDSFNQVVVIS